MFTFGSLFAGIGGLDLGLERAGMKCLWQVEIDEYCQKVLAKHWPDVKRYGDVRETGKHNLAPVDLICGGFPCQPVSVAGARKGEADERWLWPEFYRIICEVKPRWVLVENVPGLLSIDSGRLFAGILRDLAEGGYDAEWDCIPAAAVGAPHLRYRVFIVAHDNRIRCNGGRTQRQGIYWQDETCPETQSSSQDVANTEKLQYRLLGQRICRKETDAFRQSSWWAVEPDVGRVADGVPSRVDRLRTLGNAVVPQVAEWIGRRILEVIPRRR